MATTVSYRIPDPLRVNGSNVADDWRRFREPYENYEIASDLSDKSQEKRAAVFLTCIGNDAYDVYRAMEFQEADDRKKLDPIIAAFKTFCVCAVNVTYATSLTVGRRRTASVLRRSSAKSVDSHDRATSVPSRNR